jgi:hypothetical protein
VEQVKGEVSKFEEAYSGEAVVDYHSFLVEGTGSHDLVEGIGSHDLVEGTGSRGWLEGNLRSHSSPAAASAVIIYDPAVDVLVENPVGVGVVEACWRIVVCEVSAGQQSGWEPVLKMRMKVDWDASAVIVSQNVVIQSSHVESYSLWFCESAYFELSWSPFEGVPDTYAGRESGLKVRLYAILNDLLNLMGQQV